MVGHFPERHEIRKELMGIPVIVPHPIAAPVVLTSQVGVRQHIAEIVFHAGAAGHHIPPQGCFPNIVLRRRSGIIIVRNADTGGVLFVVGHHPGTSFLLGSLDPLERALVHLIPSDLQRNTGILRLVAHQPVVHQVDMGRLGVDDHVVAVGIVVVEELSKFFALLGGIGVLFSDVPV